MNEAAKPPMTPPVHRCHAIGCTVAVEPRIFMCRRHWRMVPRDVRKAIWANYRPGQEIDKRPTREYLRVAALAKQAVYEKEQGSELPR